MIKSLSKLLLTCFLGITCTTFASPINLSDWDYAKVDDGFFNVEQPHSYIYNKELPSDFSYIKITYKNFSFEHDTTTMYLFSPVQKPSAIYENKPAISLFRDYVIIDDLNGNKVEQDKAMGLSSSYCTSFSDAQWENKNIEIPTATKAYDELAFSFELNDATSYTISLWLNGVLFGTEIISDSNLNLIPENLILSFATKESIEKISDISFSKVAIPEPNTYATVLAISVLLLALYHRHRK